MKPAVRYFLQLDQTQNPLHRNACTFYSCAVNIYYNTGLKVSQERLNGIIDKAIAIGLYNPTWGASAKPVAEFFYEEIKKDFPQLKYESFLVESKRFEDVRKAGMALRIGIDVNKPYALDSQDNGYVDNNDYKTLSSFDIRHYTNMILWTQEGDEKDKSFIWDNYAMVKKFNQYYVRYPEFKVLMHLNAYVFYID